MVLPSNVGTGRVTGRFIVGVADGPDPDQDPDVIPASGTVTFAASVPYLPNPTAAPAPVTILKTSIIAVLDSEGYLCTPDPNDPTQPGYRGIRLVATDDPDLSVQGWTWNVVYSFDAVNGVRPAIQSHAIALPEGSTVDLTTAVKVPSSTGIGVEQAEALAASAQAAAVEAAASAAIAAEAAQATDTGVAALVADSDGNTTRAIAARFRRQYSVKEFGAVGDGVTDDTIAVQAAISSGMPLYWGDTGDIYRVTGMITHRATRPVLWRADGATIKCDAAAPVQRVIYLELQGQPITVTGPFTINADSKAFTGFYAANADDTRVSATLTDVTVRDTYRTSTEFTGGDGIALRGGFTTINIDRPVIRNIRMAAGAGVAGAQGVTGINVTSLTAVRSPLDVHITAPLIDGVYDEDMTSNIDQDGIKVFAAEDSVGVLSPYETKFTLTGGTIRNCGGRAVKSQAEWGSISGLKIYRGQARTRGGADIDFQVGGGQVSNLSVQYEGNSGRAVVNFSGPATTGKNVPHGSLTGLRMVVSGEQPPEAVVTVNQRNGVRSIVTVRDVECVGTQPDWLLAMNGVSEGVHSASVSDVFMSPSTTLVRGAFGSPVGWTGSLMVSNCCNTGTGSKPVYQSSSGGLAAPTVHAVNTPGFTV